MVPVPSPPGQSRLAEYCKRFGEDLSAALAANERRRRDDARRYRLAAEALADDGDEYVTCAELAAALADLRRELEGSDR